MSVTQIATIETRTMGQAEIYRGHDEATRELLYDGAFHPGIVKTLRTKDQERFSREAFGDDAGGRAIYTARIAGSLAGSFWISGRPFPTDHFPESELKPPYTVAFRTGYSTPEGGTYEGQGIAKRLALAAMTDYMLVTKDGGPDGLPPFALAGGWLDTDVDNEAGKVLYRHLGNINRLQKPVGFVDAGVYCPEPQPGKRPEKPRVGMVAGRMELARMAAAAHVLVQFKEDVAA